MGLFFLAPPAYRVVTAFVCAGATAAGFLFPGREHDSRTTREYVTELLRYEGAKYIWGGENWLGIDCSGLVRSALITANYKLGILTLNPRLVGKGFPFGGMIAPRGRWRRSIGSGPVTWIRHAA